MKANQNGDAPAAQSGQAAATWSSTFAELPKFGNFGVKLIDMSKNTSVSLGTHFDAFIEERISQGRFQNKSDVIRAGLRLLEEEENHFTLLQTAIRKGIESGIANDFNPHQHLEQLKATRKSNG